MERADETRAILYQCAQEIADCKTAADLEAWRRRTEERLAAVRPALAGARIDAELNGRPEAALWLFADKAHTLNLAPVAVHVGIKALLAYGSGCSCGAFMRRYAEVVSPDLFGDIEAARKELEAVGWWPWAWSETEGA